jgi:glycosyltransferase involved in cell wall biosynthesis
MSAGQHGILVEQTSGCPFEYEDPFEVHRWISSSEYAKNYEYVGVVEGDTKLKLLQEAAVFVLPSYSEGFSRALLEAMAAGKPVVCTPVGAHREVIQEGVHGFLVRPGDERALAEKTIELLTNSTLRKRMSETNARYVRDRFSAERIADLFTSYVKELWREYR